MLETSPHIGPYVQELETSIIPDGESARRLINLTKLKIFCCEIRDFGLLIESLSGFPYLTHLALQKCIFEFNRTIALSTTIHTLSIAKLQFDLNPSTIWAVPRVTFAGFVISGVVAYSILKDTNLIQTSPTSSVSAF